MSVTSSNPRLEEGVFDRVVCGIDESPQSFEALQQVERLRPADGSLHLLSVAELRLAVHGGFAAPHLIEQIEAGAQNALERASEKSKAASQRLIDGSPAGSLLQEIERVRATVVALGSHGGRRSVGIVLGTTATSLLHNAPCSVFLARAPADPGGFPSSILVGVEGSSASRLAFEAAGELGKRIGVPVRALAASGGKPVQLEGLRDIPGLEWDERKPLDALVDASTSADLVVVGSRGLHGLAALGSVSERLAHRVACSVLVVRHAP